MQEASPGRARVVFVVVKLASASLSHHQRASNSRLSGLLAHGHVASVTIVRLSTCGRHERSNCRQVATLAREDKVHGLE